MRWGEVAPTRLSTPFSGFCSNIAQGLPALAFQLPFRDSDGKGARAPSILSLSTPFSGFMGSYYPELELRKLSTPFSGFRWYNRILSQS